ncbi:MAG: P1 family peptidase [Gemmatimonadales bacterium]|nr:P1 family peptidase [Gemmatimonadales bacterium]
MPLFRSSVALLLLAAASASAQGPARPRARDLGVAPGVFPPGPLNAITDVDGVRVGQTTLIEGDSIRSGVTAILPHGGNAFLDRVPAAAVVGNGFGKLIGTTQIGELGELETPILLTCTLCVWKAADAMVDWLLEQPGMEGVRSINPVVGETNDGGLNAIRLRPVTPAAVRSALTGASGGPVAEGTVGAGTGTIAFGWTGGIGTSSRRLPKSLGGWTVGVLVQSNFGGVFEILGVPVGKELGQYAFRRDVEGAQGGGSIMMVVATDAPIDDRALRRLGGRALLGMGRTGGFMSNGSGDYVIAFATHPAVRRRVGPGAPRDTMVTARRTLSNDEMSALFEGAVEATEEAIYNSMFRATTVTSRVGTVEALPLDRVRALLERYGAARR